MDRSSKCKKWDLHIHNSGTIKMTYFGGRKVEKMFGNNILPNHNEHSILSIYIMQIVISSKEVKANFNIM